MEDGGSMTHPFEMTTTFSLHGRIVTKGIWISNSYVHNWVNIGIFTMTSMLRYHADPFEYGAKLQVFAGLKAATLFSKILPGRQGILFNVYPKMEKLSSQIP